MQLIAPILIIIILYCIFYYYYKETFLIDERQILNDNGQNYYNTLNALDTWINTNMDTTNNDGLLARLKNDIKQVSDSRNINKESILSLFTNIYILNYINRMNTQNAESYKMFNKYSKS